VPFRPHHANIFVSLVHPTESEGFVVVEMDTRIDKVEDFGVVEPVWLAVSSDVETVQTDTIVLRLHMNATETDATRERRLQRIERIFLNDENQTDYLTPLTDTTLVPEQAQGVKNLLISIFGPNLRDEYKVYPDFQAVVVSVYYLGANDGEGIIVLRIVPEVVFLPSELPTGELADTPTKQVLDTAVADLFEDISDENGGIRLKEEINGAGISGLPGIVRFDLSIEDPDVLNEDLALIWLTSAPSARPSSAPSSLPSVAPTTLPSSAPSVAPTGVPSASPSDSPSLLPSSGPSAAPSAEPSTPPSDAPSTEPSAAPTVSNAPTPLFAPSDSPSLSSAPSLEPIAPSSAPSSGPSLGPTVWGPPDVNNVTSVNIPPSEIGVKVANGRRLQREFRDDGGDDQEMINGVLGIYGEIMEDLFNSTYPGIFKELVLDVIYLGEDNGEFKFQISGQVVFYNGGPTIPSLTELASIVSEESRLDKENLTSELQELQRTTKVFGDGVTIENLSVVNLDYDIYVITRTEVPSASPTTLPPSKSPSESPSSMPSSDPSGVPSTDAPTVSNPPSFEFAPSASPSLSSEPSSTPSSFPSGLPSSEPSGAPSSSPSSVPSGSVSFGLNECYLT